MATCQALPSSLPIILGSRDLTGLRPLHPMHQHGVSPCETLDLWTSTDPSDGPGMLAWLPALGILLPGQGRPAYTGRLFRPLERREGKSPGLKLRESKAQSEFSAGGQADMGASPTCELYDRGQRLSITAPENSKTQMWVPQVLEEKVVVEKILLKRSKRRHISSARAWSGPAAAFKGPPRGRAAGHGPEAESPLRLRTAYQRDPEFREKAPGEEGKVAEGGRPWEESASYANHRRERGLGAGLSMQSRVRLRKREGAGPATLGLFPRVSDVADVPFKSGRAGAVGRNANLGCYTTAGSVSAAATAAASAVPGISGPPPPPLTHASGSLPEPPSACTGRSRPSASRRRPSPPGALAAPADMSGDHLHNDSQVRPGPAQAPDPRRRPWPRRRPGRFDRPEPPAGGGRPEEIGSLDPRRKPPSYNSGGWLPPQAARGPLHPWGRGIEGDFRLNGECAPDPEPPSRRPPTPRPARAGQRTDMASQRLSPGSSLTGPIVPIGPPLDPLSGDPSAPRSRPSPEGATETPRRPPPGLGRPFRARIPPGKVALSTMLMIGIMALKRKPPSLDVNAYVHYRSLTTFAILSAQNLLRYLPAIFTFMSGCIVSSSCCLTSEMKQECLRELIIPSLPGNGPCISSTVDSDTLDKESPLVELVIRCIKQRISTLDTFMARQGTDSAPCACLLKQQRDPIEIETENEISSMSIIASGRYLVLIIVQRTKKQQGKRAKDSSLLPRSDYPNSLEECAHKLSNRAALLSLLKNSSGAEKQKILPSYSHKHKDKHKDREHRHKEHKKDKEKDREKSKHSNRGHGFPPSTALNLSRLSHRNLLWFHWVQPQESAALRNGQGQQMPSWGRRKILFFPGFLLPSPYFHPFSHPSAKCLRGTLVSLPCCVLGSNKSEIKGFAISTLKIVEHKDSEKKHKEKEKTKHKDGSSEKHKDKHKDRDKEKRKEEKVRASGDAKIKKEKENGFSSPPRIKDEPEDDGYFAPPKEDIKPLKRPRDEDDADYKPKKIKTEDIKKEKKRKPEEEEDGKLKKPKNKDKDKKVPEPDSKKKKPKKEEEQKWKWWEEERYPEGIKWKFLEHKGPVFAPPYEPLPENVKFYYDGEGSSGVYLILKGPFGAEEVP
ncbi:hypothetical protein HPG69_017434 [Diceros bicornis minor]|uniref:DNA topoisomerase I DNA binding eukaryotic-type domain-containing protein n=1 Tax=Diceros bicornis minor TaxID=77932 RepID=A0A7J7EP15_DICBM|nr:hypothetical protein HPG69_017434 [Diceros bicornis minor]